MRPISYWRPKPLVPIADAPLIVHIIRGFVAAGVREICVVIGHLAAQVEKALGDGAAWGAKLTYVRQLHPRGTGDAVLCARFFLGREPFMLSWGDILVPLGHYQRMRQLFTPDVDGVLSVNWVEDPWEGAAVYVQEGLVRDIVEKPPRGTSTTHYNNAGIFILPPRLLDLLTSLSPSERGEVELPQALAALVATDGRLRAAEVEGYWSDVARPASVITMNGVVVQATAAGGVWLAGEVELPAGVRLQPPVYLGPGVRVGTDSTLGPFASLQAEAQLGEEVTASYCLIGEGATVERNCWLEHAYLEAGTHLPPGNVLRGTSAAPLVLPPPT
jgi:NDP-sugar pyrophosphorylase family protein